MPAPDLRAMGEQVLVAVKGHTARAVEPLVARLDSLERAAQAAPSAEFVRAEVSSAAARLALDFAALVSRAPDGKPIAVEDVRPIVEAAIAALPVPKDGLPGERGADGKSVDQDEIAAMVSAEVARGVAVALPEATDARVKDLADAFVSQLMAATVEQQ